MRAFCCDMYLFITYFELFPATFAYYIKELLPPIFDLSTVIFVSYILCSLQRRPTQERSPGTRNTRDSDIRYSNHPPLLQWEICTPMRDLYWLDFQRFVLRNLVIVRFSCPSSLEVQRILKYHLRFPIMFTMLVYPSLSSKDSFRSHICDVGNLVLFHNQTLITPLFHKKRGGVQGRFS
jgi:hypothetical protein